MAVILWWKDRLIERRPIGADSLWLLDVSYKPPKINPEDGWPRAIAKQFLLLDYQKWFQEKYLPPYLETGFYSDCPAQLPRPATDLEFFTAMAPLLHLVGRDQQTRSYNVREQHQYEGQWVSVRVKKNFVRLLEWKEHVAAFELQTGITIDPLQAVSDTSNIEVVAKGVKVVIRRMADAREALDRTMGNVKT